MEDEFDNLLRLLDSEVPEQVVLGIQLSIHYEDLCLQRLSVDAGSYVICKLLNIKPIKMTLLELIICIDFCSDFGLNFIKSNFLVLSSMGILPQNITLT